MAPRDRVDTLPSVRQVRRSTVVGAASRGAEAAEQLQGTKPLAAQNSFQRLCLQAVRLIGERREGCVATGRLCARLPRLNKAAGEFLLGPSARIPA